MHDRLQKFARLAEIGNFTKAAKVLHISQPALSIAIDKLEQELGSTLIVRSGRKFDLTEAGKAAYAAALEHQNITDHLRVNLNRIAKKRPAVTVGMIDSVAAVVCATPEFEALESVADVTVVVNNSRYLRESIEGRHIDAAFVIDDGAEHPALQMELFGVEELVVVCHPDLMASAASELGANKLTRFISYDKPSTTYRHIQQSLQLKGIKTQVLLYSSSPAVMLDMSLRGKGIAALPQMLVKPYLENGSLVELHHEDTALVVQRPVTIAKLRGRELSPSLDAFVGSMIKAHRV